MTDLRYDAEWFRKAQGNLEHLIIDIEEETKHELGFGWRASCMAPSAYETLLKEFEEYKASATRKLKVFRMEAVRAGFKKAWQERDYATIIAVARKVPENVLQEDPQLLMWYDQALTRSGGE